MEKGEILTVLSSQETIATSSLRNQAKDLISSATIDNLPTTLLDLLTQIIKPLFTSTKHPSLTSTGRKNLVSGPPSFGPSYASLDDDEAQTPWKTPFTVPLLEYILTTYPALPEHKRKPTIEAHFHLLIPPILNMIDDSDTRYYKASGCKLLRLLCELLSAMHSDMLKRTGLGDVFVDALKTNFNLLPTLTPEEESLALFRALYPAYLAVADAWYPTHTDQADGAESKKKRDSLLTALYRHGIMASIEHLSSAGSFSSTISVGLTTFLLTQIPPVFERMGLSSGLLPMLRTGLMDPFILVAPEMVFAVLDVVECVIRVGAPRVKEKWYPEILRGLVGCWCNCLDEIENDSKMKTAVDEVMTRLQRSVRMLRNVVDKKEWKDVTERLEQEEVALTELFD
ncbi:hypothetical protein LTR99_004577 [Exophiala xenobiotica]|uniref:Uncharacterized protein n=1 Tax=Vermiconidia calcicola TaxID=1690605 RepID=A0AAV9QE91_9PEZI|nr:hypothetical protein LTR92_000323 [Exophiala xenobiotica]KAK5539857.1 hypothetical protein LTR25_003562 [Vermiconidia calcicola]KAK5547023.1 hypothetical protein LTR23_003026 [Chaetothyriales sp. CCFEE 6169]KAK5224721.1 hypothetical protein LTR72_004502 [Exophiala xenobiotica]KAK5237404.1 hypothetical protein LTR47_001670 [Exophiala xenobiotica]